MVPGTRHLVSDVWHLVTDTRYQVFECPGIGIQVCSDTVSDVIVNVPAPIQSKSVECVVE